MSGVTESNFLKTLGLSLLVGLGISQYTTTGMIGPLRTRRYYLYKYYGIQWNNWERGIIESPPRWPEWEELPPEYRLGYPFCWQNVPGDNRTLWEKFTYAHFPQDNSKKFQ